MWWVFFIFWDTFQLLLSSSNKAFFSKGNVCKRSFLLLIGISLPSLTSLVFYNKLFLFLWTNHTLNSKEQLGCEVSLYKYHCISVVCAVQSTTNLTEMQSCPAVKAFLFDIAFFFFFWSTISLPMQSLYLGTGTSKLQFIRCLYLFRWTPW